MPDVAFIVVVALLLGIQEAKCMVERMDGCFDASFHIFSLKANRLTHPVPGVDCECAPTHLLMAILVRKYLDFTKFALTRNLM